MARLRSVRRFLLIVAISGVLGGAMFGLALRAAMRLAAIMEGHTSFTAGGTTGLVIGGVMIGVPASIIVGFGRRFVPGSREAVSRAYGLASWVVPGLFFFGSPDLLDEMSERGVLEVNLITFSLCFLLLGASVAWITATLDDRLGSTFKRATSGNTLIRAMAVWGGASTILALPMLIGASG